MFPDQCYVEVGPGVGRGWGEVVFVEERSEGVEVGGIEDFDGFVVGFVGARGFVVFQVILSMRCWPVLPRLQPA